MTRAPRPAPGGAGGSRRGRRAFIPGMTDGDDAVILIVEDEFLLAFAVSEMLEDAGYPAVEVAGTVAAALEVVDRGGVRAALVDLNLGAETSERVIERLRREGIAYTMCTAYSPDQLPAFAADAPTIHKPVDEARMLEAVRAMGVAPGPRDVAAATAGGA